MTNHKKHSSTTPSHCNTPTVRVSFSMLQFPRRLRQFLQRSWRCRLMCSGSPLSLCCCRSFWPCSYSGEVQTFVFYCVPVVSRKIKASFPLCFFGGSRRNRFLSKVQRLSSVADRGALSPPLPSVRAVPEGQALVTFAPPSYRERPEDEQETQELRQNERAEDMNFNNTSYFFVQRENGE